MEAKPLKYNFDDFEKVFDKVIDEMREKRKNDHWVVYPNFTPDHIFPDIWDVKKSHSNCLHDNCPECHGSGKKDNGGYCVHFISCPCPKCSPTC